MAASVTIGLMMAMMVLASAAAAAQCTSVEVTNHLNSKVTLRLYGAKGGSPKRWEIGAGALTTITIPAGFVLAGVVSAGGKRYPFNTLGCAKCCAQITGTPPAACGVICYDRAGCTLLIGECTTSCEP